MITNGGRIMFQQLVAIDKKNTKLEFKQTFNMAARYPFKLEVVSLNYKGFDLSKDFQLDVRESSEERNVFIFLFRKL